MWFTVIKCFWYANNVYSWFSSYHIILSLWCNVISEKHIIRLQLPKFLISSLAHAYKLTQAKNGANINKAKDAFIFKLPINFLGLNSTKEL